MTPEINAAIEEIRETFPENSITVKEEPNGDVCLLVHGLAIGDQYTPTTSWVGFKITAQYPFADIYPHFIDANVHRSDGSQFGGGIQVNHNFVGQPAIMLSRRSNHWNPATDTVAQKLIKVLDWFRKQ